MKHKGLFITFEGGEGVGKSTLIESVKEYLHSLDMDLITTIEPGGTDFGKNIREILLNKENTMCPQAEFFLYLADRAYHVDSKILPALEEEKVVLCDRFTDSSIAYQGAARGFVSVEEIETMSLVATQNLNPDITFLLDVDPQVSLERLTGSKDRLEMESLSFHEKVRDGYLKIAQDNPHRVKILDASKTKEEIFSEVKEFLSGALKNFNLNNA